jgi:chorismate mutase
MEQTIIELREEIDSIDLSFINLLERRMNLAEILRNIKKQNNIPIRNRAREQEILNKINTTHNFAIKSIFKKIMQESRKLQEKLK